MIRVCPVEDEKFTNVSDMSVNPETVVPVPVMNRTFCSPGCGLLPLINKTDAEAMELAKLSPAMPAIRSVFRFFIILWRSYVGPPEHFKTSAQPLDLGIKQRQKNAISDDIDLKYRKQ